MSGEESPEGDENDPFDELDDRPPEGFGGQTEAPADALFAAADVDTLGAEQLWGELEDPLPVEATSTADGSSVGDAVVAKDRYCESCRYLSDPPTVSCTHAGTAIVEFVDREHVRVRNCPIVARRRARGGTD